jgi:biopolymer transport protein ExbD
MKLSLFRENKVPSDAMDENDIDIAPVMNMFIILVTFLVSMAVFTHMAILDFTLPPNVNTGLDMSKGKPKVKITVRLGSDYCGIVMGEKLLDSLPVTKGGEFPFDALATQLAVRRKDASVQDEVVIASLDEDRLQARRRKSWTSAAKADSPKSGFRAPRSIPGRASDAANVALYVIGKRKQRHVPAPAHVARGRDGDHPHLSHQDIFNRGKHRHAVERPRTAGLDLTKLPKPQWSIEIARDMIMSEGTVIASTKTFAKQDSLLVPELYKWLEKKRTQRADSSTKLLLQCDREVPYAIVKKVMYTCSKASFTDFSMLVIQEE